MSDFVSNLLQWLNAHPELAGLVTFLISAGESVAILGTIVPGSIMMTALGTLAGAGVIPLWGTIFWAILGAIAGDGISYWLGYHFKDGIGRMWPFKHYPSLLITGERFVHKYGVMSVFIGRFVGPVRALVPLVAGMLGMRPLQFTIANIASAIGWAPAYMLPGILIGAASLELPPDIAIHVILALMLMALFVLLCLWFVYKTLQLIHNQTTQLQNYLWAKLRASRLKPATLLLKHHNGRKTHGQLTLAFYFLLCIIVFLALAIYAKIVGPHTLAVNDAVFHLFRGLRNPTVDKIMLNITLLGQKQILLPVILILFAWLIVCKRWRVAFHALALGVLAAGSVFVIKNVLRSPRPWGILASPETFSMPSGHVTLATAVYVGLAFLIAQAIAPKRRVWIYGFVLIIPVLVGVSRLYLGAHWFTDVIGALLLSTALLFLVIISYQRQAEAPINPWGLTIVTVIALTFTFGAYHHFNFRTLTKNYAQINWPIVEVSMNEWWNKNDVLPAYHTSLFGFPSQQINIAWAGDLKKISQSLQQEGWHYPPARDWISTLHRISDVKSSEYLPLISPQYLDKQPELILVRHSLDGKKMLVLRLWSANRIIAGTQIPLWVGVVALIPRPYGWIFQTHADRLRAHAQLVFPLQKTIHQWDWKMITVDKGIGKRKPVHQSIILIRPNKPN